MMIKKYEVLSLFLLFLNYSCTSQSKQEGTINKNTFSTKMFGWTMNIPDNWEITQKNEVDSQNQKGFAMMDKSNLTELQKSELQKQLSKSIYLLGFKQNKQNMFTAIAEPFDTATVTFEKQNSNTKEVLCKFLKQIGFQIDTTWGHELIQNKEFKTFQVVAKKDDKTVNQIYFNRQIDNYMFTIILLYNNKETKDILLEHFRNSRFDK
jgi:hypothetical protein